MKNRTTPSARPLSGLLPLLFASLLGLAGLGLGGCLDFGKSSEGEKPGPGPGAGDTVSLALARVKAVALDGAGDTSVTSYTYDAQGLRVRERFDSTDGGVYIVWEWDAQGRYARWVQPRRGDTIEVSTWATADSSARGAPRGTLITRERWFGLKANCRCADSAYRYAFNASSSQETLLHVRRYTYDAQGHLTLVTRDFTNPARRDTAQRYVNTYAGEKLVSRLAYDAETEEDSRQFFEYAPLDSLLEAR